MAFPSIDAAASSRNTANGTTLTVSIPNGSDVAGKRIVVAINVDNQQSVTFPAGWTQLGTSGDGNAGNGRLFVYYHDTDGTEGYPSTGATISVTVATSDGFASVAYLISAFDTGTAPEIAFVSQSATGTDPNPPSITPTGGAKDYLFLAFGGFDGSAANTPSISAYPTNYSLNQTTQSPGFTNGCGCAGAGRQLNTAGPEDPGAFTLSAAEQRAAATVAIHPVAATNVTGSGSPSTSLSSSASGTGAETFTGSGSPSTSLSSSVSGTGVLTITASGSPSVSLSVSATGTGTHIQNVTGSGAPSVSLSASASGTGTHIQNVTGSGSPSVSLSASVSATGVLTITGSGSPSKTLSSSASGTGAETISGSGSPSTSLSVSASGTGTVVVNVTGSGSPSVSLSASASGTMVYGDGSVARRGGGFRRILYDPKGAQAEIDARPEWSPDDLPVEAKPLPGLEPLPERPKEPTPETRLPKKRVAATVEIVDDDDEIDFILNVVLDLD